ncbi:MAG: YifB family Mg chelatase-like AAA ATPase, partial [Muribaculaceae bacterium]|nr:YifB family Mg chelatase-like AAA ATPase [Muribaculaceae bacterium]
AAVKESHQRIISALSHNSLKFPRRKVVVNLAPADIKKEGSAYDLPIAIGLLAANEEFKSDRFKDFLIMGELSLDGSILPIKGALPIAIMAKEQGYKGFILPKENASEAAVIDGLKVYGVENITEVVNYFNESQELAETVIDAQKEFYDKQNLFDIDFEDVKGQENVKRAFEIAAAGGHNLIMIGPPGSGKSMLAKRIPTILPPLTLDEALETTKIHSVAGRLSESGALVTRRPFRSPHHTISGVALVGGGTYPQPGEISLAHNGVLFLDELPEFSRSVLEVMRQPLEDRKITISRAKNTVEYPAGIMLVASMNPCPCGYYNHPTKECICSEGAVSRYLNRISGPLLDRIDIQIEVVPVEFEKLSSTTKGESSSVIRERVIRAREMQTERFKDTPGVYCNAQMNTRLLNKWALPDSDSIAMLKTAMERFNLSARAYDRILKVARTIADLDGSERVKSYHIQEAITYRNLDRGNWGR